MELVGFAAPELGVLGVDGELTLGGGWFRRLPVSLSGGGEDEDGACLEISPLDLVFGAALLLVFPVGGSVYELSVAGGGGRTRPGPFDGRYGVPSASEEG